MYNLVNIISITKINAKLYNVSVRLTVALKFGLASPLGSQVLLCLYLSCLDLSCLVLLCFVLSCLGFVLS